MAQDEGASLVIALIITTVVALVVGAVLGLSGASVDATVATTTQARSTAAVDAAAQVAINTVQNSTYNNDVASATYPKCFGNTGTSDSMVVPYPGGGGSTYVTCAPDPGSGAAGGSVPVTDQNKPGQAILTLGTSGAPIEDGQNYGQSNKAIYVRGGVLSNSNINSQKADFHVIGPGAQVKAMGPCTGTITPACTTITTPQPDPNYPLPTDAPAPPASLPACTDNTKVADFLPGLYSNADMLSTCKASWIYFHPGTYFFDFTTGSTHVWTLNSTAVGGTLTAAETNIAPAVPGACVNPIESASAVGVELRLRWGQPHYLLQRASRRSSVRPTSSAAIPTVLYGLKSSVVNGSVHCARAKWMRSFHCRCSRCDLHLGRRQRHQAHVLLRGLRVCADGAHQYCGE